MKKVGLLIFGLIFLFAGTVMAEEKEEKWKGIDEAVIEKIAEERGRAPKSIFNLEGDTELFVFSLFSGLAGFVAGYYWRKLLSEGQNAPSRDISSSLFQKD